MTPEQGKQCDIAYAKREESLFTELKTWGYMRAMMTVAFAAGYQARIDDERDRPLTSGAKT